MCGSPRRLATALFCVAAAWTLMANGQEPPRRSPDRLAEGVLTVIPAEVSESDTVAGPATIPEIIEGMPDLKWSPNFAPESETVYARAQQVLFRRPIWCLEFAFKPLRMVEVDVPQQSGKMQRKRIWYLVYRVKNDGYDLNPTGGPDKWGHTVYGVERVNFQTRRFLPHVVLHSFEFDKEYLDRVIPSAQIAIEQRERMTVKLHNSVEIGRVPIELSDERVDRSVWGVAMWEDVDPRMDFFCVDVGGLTNAFRVVEPAPAGKDEEATGKQRVMQKVLQLNFWRPGDSVLEHESEFHYGIPIDANPALQEQILRKYGVERRLDHLWVYR